MQEEKNCFCLDDTLIVKEIEVKNESSANLLVPEGVKDKSMLSAHPFQAKVVLVGPLLKDIIDKGDILYLDRLPIESDLVVLNGKVHRRVRKGNIMFVKSKNQ